MRQTIHRPRLLTVCGAAALAIAAEGLCARPAAWTQQVGPQTSSAGAPNSERALVRVDVLGTPPDRATGTTRTGVQKVLGPGERMTWYLAADNGLTGNLCSGAMSVEAPTQAAARWRVEVEVVEASAARATVAVAWTRARLRAGAFTDEVEGRRTVQLDFGEHQVLDYLGDATSPVCANVLLQLGVESAPTPQPQASMVFDLWLEYDGRLGRRWEHRQVTARSGVQTPFRFEGMAWALEQTSADVAVSPVRLEVSGTVLGRLRDDGFVDIALRAHRQLSWAGSGVGGSGQVDYRAALGEAAGLPLPHPSSEFRKSYPPLAAIVSPGVSFRNGKWVLDVKQFLDGTVTLHVTATREP
jgi:hypothetical protein